MGSADTDTMGLLTLLRYHNEMEGTGTSINQHKITNQLGKYTAARGRPRKSMMFTKNQLCQGVTVKSYDLLTNVYFVWFTLDTYG